MAAPRPVEPGWDPDPSGLHQLRFWDGTRWTEHVEDYGERGTDPLPGEAPTGTPAPPSAARTSPAATSSPRAGPPAAVAPPSTGLANALPPPAPPLALAPMIASAPAALAADGPADVRTAAPSPPTPGSSVPVEAQPSDKPPPAPPLPAAAPANGATPSAPPAGDATVQMPPVGWQPSEMPTTPAPVPPVPLPTVSADTVTELVAGVETLVLRIRDLSTHHKGFRRYPELRDLAVTAFQRAQLLKLELAGTQARPLTGSGGPEGAGVDAVAPVPDATAAVGCAGDAPGMQDEPAVGDLSTKSSWRARRRDRRAAKAARRGAATKPSPEPPAAPAAPVAHVEIVAAAVVPDAKSLRHHRGRRRKAVSEQLPEQAPPVEQG